MVEEKKNDKENIASVKARSLSISTKKTVEICNLIREKKVNTAIKRLELSLSKKVAIPYNKHNKDTPHKRGKGMMAGRFPIKTIKVIIGLLNSLKANGSDKGLNAESLLITKAIANKGAERFHYGRQRGIRMKVTHVDLEAKEVVEKKKEPKKTEENKVVEKK